MLTAPQDLRRAPRFPALVKVDVRVAVEGEAPESSRSIVSNLSRTGMFVASPARAAVGQTLYFEFDTPLGHCLAVGNVIGRRGELGFVVEFQGESGGTLRFFEVLHRVDEGSRWDLLQSITDARIEIV